MQAVFQNTENSTLTVNGVNPTIEIEIVEPGFAEMEKSPLSLVVVASLVPLTETVAPLKGFDAESVTVPVIFVWEFAAEVNKASINKINACRAWLINFFLSIAVC